MEGAVFLTALQNAAENEGAEVARACLGCHAPLAETIRDTELTSKLAWEGVGCDVCHSVAAVDASGPNPRMVFDLGGPKRGPIRDAESSAHGVEYSDLHESSLICLGCHEYTNPQGDAILSTYSEWKASTAAAAGKNCQDCHMARTEANVVDPSVKRVTGVPVNLHEMPGGHSLGLLTGALRATVGFERRGDDLAVSVKIGNKGAGHAVPTGMPGRRLILAVTVRTKSATFEEKRVYTKLFADAAGDTITRDGGCFAPGARLLADTRLQSGEQRTESFAFRVPASESASISMKVHYEHSPTGRPEDRTWLTVLSEDRLVRPAPAIGS